MTEKSTTKKTKLPVKAEDRAVLFVPMGEEEAIELTIRQIQAHLATPTKTGKVPGVSECAKFAMLCKSRGLNPWVGDAFLIGYDTKDGPKFTLITSIQALLKRAEISPEFDGLEAGVLVETENGELESRPGTATFRGDTLLGAWAKVHRKDRSVPFYSSLNLSTYNSRMGRWGDDPSGMIVKCAKAAALRDAFPSQLSQMYLRDEMDNVGEARKSSPPSHAKQVTLEDLTTTPPQADKPLEPMEQPAPEPPADVHPWAPAIADVKALPDAKKQIQAYNSLIEQAKDRGEQEVLEMLKIAIKASIAISEAAKGALLGSIEL